MPGERALWFGVVGGPAAWAADLLTAFTVQQSYCTAAPIGMIPFTHVPLWLIVAGIATMAIAAAAALTAWQSWETLHGAGEEATARDPAAERRRFMAGAGVAISVLFLFTIVLRWGATFFVPASFCGQTG